MTLMPVDPTSEVAVTSYLEQAKKWLSTAVENTGPEQIAQAKAAIATAAEATKQLNLSRDIQLDAQEMVRRAEFALGKAIRKGQDEGTIETTIEARRRATAIREVNQGRKDQSDIATLIKAQPTDYAEHNELFPGGGGVGIYDLSDNATEEELEQALTEARDEGNVSRANVVRKIKGCGRGPAVVTREMRAEVIRDLAEQGYTSRQMVDKVSVSAETVRQIARDFGIDIHADKVIGGRRGIQHTESVDRIVTKVENTVSAFQYVDLNEVDFSQADEWVASLAASISALNRIKKQIAKEATHVV